MKLRKIITSTAIGAFALGASILPAFAAPSGYSVKPSVYDPDKTGIIVSEWQTHQGLADSGNSDHALFLQKNGPTTTNAAAVASVDGVSGITLTEIGWDTRDDGHCGAGAPRFNVVTNDNVTHFIGCNSPAPVSVSTLTDSRGQAWTRRRYDPATAFPAITPGSTVKSISIVFDEGTDQGTGSVYVDNIDINGTLIGKPGNAQ